MSEMNVNDNAAQIKILPEVIIPCMLGNSDNIVGRLGELTKEAYVLSNAISQKERVFKIAEIFGVEREKCIICGSKGIS